MLPDIKIRTTKLPEGKTQIKLTDGEGLYLLVLKSGKYWRFDYRFARKRKTLALGVYPAMSAKNARKRKMEAREMLAEGMDPSQMKKQAEAKRRAETQAVTFEGVARDWFKEYN